jgi:hypothetical protein
LSKSAGDNFSSAAMKIFVASSYSLAIWDSSYFPSINTTNAAGKSAILLKSPARSLSIALPVKFQLLP